MLFFEQNCLFCGCIGSEQICNDCYLALPWLKHQPRCPRCLLYLWPKEVHCTNCQQNPPRFEQLICGFEYAFPLNKLLHSLKYQGRIEYSKLLSQLFWAGIHQQLSRLPDVIIPVPLHLNKHKQRGFNQVDELLRKFRQQHNNINSLLARRTKETLPQAALNRQQRVYNLAGAFHLEHSLQGLHIAIVDDVVTTTATVNELASMCRELGAQQIDIWCLMRTQLS